MKYRNIGHSGLITSEIALGIHLNFNDESKYEQNKQVVAAAYENGVVHFDGAEAYGGKLHKADRQLGRMLDELNLPRESYLLSWKVITYDLGPKASCRLQKGLNRKHLHHSLEKTLSAFKTDYIDLMYCHHFDAATPLEETCEAVNDLIRAGKVLYWGTSHFSATDLLKIHRACDQNGWSHPVAEQSCFCLRQKERHNRYKDIAPILDVYGTGIVGAQPLDGGLLTGKYQDKSYKEGRGNTFAPWFLNRFSETDPDYKRLIPRLPQLNELAREHDLSLAQLAVGWVLQQWPKIACCLVGASKPEQIVELCAKIDTVEEEYPYGSDIWKAVESIIWEGLE
jgi:aryl-alcohol dehydrogenase-like predicted oxidoreductase